MKPQCATVQQQTIEDPDPTISALEFKPPVSRIYHLYVLVHAVFFAPNAQPLISIHLANEIICPMW